jgi:hypothetical protein
VNFLKRSKTRYILHRYGISHSLWLETIKKLTITHRLSAVEKAHLRELSTLFIYQKNFIGVEIEIDQAMKVLIAALACLPILHLGNSLLADWRDIVIYPCAFRVNRDETDEAGVVHHQQKVLSGEAWTRGPLIISWDDVLHDLQNPHQGHNVIIHELAHKLDMLNGRCNGMPPLHPNMSIIDWSQTLSEAYQQLHQRLDHHHRIRVNPYAATNPAEFFAVFSEYFFSNPAVLSEHFAAVYQQLQLYYRQNPLHQAMIDHLT